MKNFARREHWDEWICIIYLQFDVVISDIHIIEKQMCHKPAMVAERSKTTTF